MIGGIYILLLIFLVGFYGLSPGNMNKTTMACLLIIVVFSLILFAFRRERNVNIKGQYLKHSTLLLVGILIVFFQFPLDFVLGNISKSNLFIWINNSIVVKSLTLSVIGLLCFLLGYLFYRNRLPSRVAKMEKPLDVKLLTFCAVVSLVIYFATVNPLYIAGYYGSVEMGTTATYAILVFQVCIFASIIQKCRNMILLNQIPSTIKQYLAYIGWILLASIGIYILSVVMSGDRGPIIYYGMLLFSGYFYVTKRKLSWKYALLFFFIGASLITVLGLARSLNKNLSFADKIVQSINQSDVRQVKSIVPQTKDLAGSVLTLNAAVNYVPEKHGFLYGRFQFQSLISVIPFYSVFSPLLFSDRSTRYKGSASFITWIIQGDNPTYGNGTSIIADFYLDFGLLGVMLGMFVVGYLMRFSEIMMYSRESMSLFAHSFVVIYLSYAIYISRSAFLFNLKMVFWVFIALLLNKYVLNRTYI